MKKQSKILILIDMQDFFLKKFTPSLRKKLVDNQIALISRCVKKKIPIVLIEYKGGRASRGKTISILKNKTLPVLQGVVEKENNSGFTKTNFDAILEKLKTKEIILAGINANGCIQDTAIGALYRKYKVTTSLGIIGSTSRKDLGLSKRNKDWYIKNTNFFNTPKELINYIN